MKKLLIYLTMIGLFAMSNLTAQIPQAFKYQAAIRDTTGQVLQNKLISLRISILKGDLEGEEVYSEIHDVFTDQFGLVSLNIGQGLDVSREFSTIPWGEDTFFLQIEMDMDGAMNYHLLGTSQLMAVPYALYAESAGNTTWNKTENGIFYSEGRVGISTTDPESTLDVHGRNIELADYVFLGRMYSGTDLLLGHNIKAIDYENTRGAYVANDWPLGYSGIRMYNGTIQFHAKGGYVHKGELASNELMRIVSNGNVGIGTTNPITPLHIKGTSNLYQGREMLLVQNNSTDEASHATIKLMSGNGSTSTKLQHTAESYEWEERSEFGMLGNDGQGLVLQATNEEGEIRFETGGAGSEKERMRITKDGKVGIGTHNPQHKFHLEGTTNGANNRTFLKLHNNSTDMYSSVNMHLSAGEGNSCLSISHSAETYTGSQWGDYRNVSAIWNQGDGLVLRSSSNGRLSFEVYDENANMFSEKMRMDGEGNFGIGTTSPQRKLHINDAMRLEPSLAPPKNPSEGDIYMDGNDHILKVYNGTEWKSCW